MIPAAALEAFAERWVGAAGRPDDGPDPHWTEQLEAEVGRAAMTCGPASTWPPMSLGDIAGLRAGQVLACRPAPASNVRLSCGGETLFRCDLGQSAGLYTVRVEERTAADRHPRARID